MTELSLAKRERAAICEEFERVGPDAATLCGTWTCHELAAHLAMREARPDGALGIAVPRLHAHAQRLEREYAKRPYDELIERIRTGPPMASPFRVPGVDSAANTAEYFVHHEDVIRAQPEWVRRTLSQSDSDRLWRLLKMRARLLARSAPVGIGLQRTDRTTQTFWANGNERRVIVAGEPGELLLFLFGRKAHAQVDVVGDERDVANVLGADYSV